MMALHPVHAFGAGVVAVVSVAGLALLPTAHTPAPPPPAAPVITAPAPAPAPVTVTVNPATITALVRGRQVHCTLDPGPGDYLCDGG